MKTPVFAAFVSLALSSIPVQGANPEPAPGDSAAAREFIVRPVGRVEKEGERFRIVIEEKYQPALLGLERFSHIHVIWWFDRNDTAEGRAVLQVHPRGNRENPLSGVFATRSPFRPNLIALSLCKVVAVRGNVIEVDTIDALPGTPVIDIKPFTPAHDSAKDARGPAWKDG